MERRSVARGGIVLLVLSLLRAGLEAGGGAPPLPAGEESDLEELLGASLQARDEAARRAEPLGPGERLDPNRNGEMDLDRLPGVGPVVASAIIREREQNGGFRNAQELLRVPGIGPATLRAMEPHLDLTGGIPMGLRTRRRQDPAAAPPPGEPLLRGRGSASQGKEAATPIMVNVNSASLEELQRLPGIGPVLAQRIVESRSTHGPFRTMEDLLRVSGIGPATLEGLKPLILPGG
jgi:competence protein ComEA